MSSKIDEQYLQLDTFLKLKKMQQPRENGKQTIKHNIIQLITSS